MSLAGDRSRQYTETVQKLRNLEAGLAFISGPFSKLRAQVDLAVGGLALASTLPNDSMLPDEACDLARWILSTFGEGPS